MTAMPPAEHAGDPLATAHPDLLVSTAWLAANLDNLHGTGLRLVDCRYTFNPGPSGEDMYRAGHIPGAVYLNLEAINTPQDEEPEGMPWMIAGPERFAAAMAAHGIGSDTQVIAYDDEGDHYAARLWWALALYGHQDCRLLSGGLTRWLAEGRPLEEGTGAPPPPATFTPRPPRPGLRATAGEVLAALGNPQVAVVDVRRPSEYSGAEVRAARGGHIPGAIPLFWRDNLNWEADAGGAASGAGGMRDWRPEADLRARHREAGLTPDRRVVTYCQLGVRAAHAAFTLRLLGYPDVGVYDGSWYEWAAGPDRPVAAGPDAGAAR